MNPLDQLKDIQLPQEVGNWPPAYGWWILAVLVIGAVLASFILLSKRHRARLAKRQALAELDTITEQQQDWPQQLNRLLKRLAITYYPQTAIAILHDRAWAEFLSAQLPAKKRPVFLQAFLLLQQGLYRKNADKTADFEQSTLQVQLWIKHTIPPRSLSQQTPSPALRANEPGREHV
jgi:hypothetical protein